MRLDWLICQDCAVGLRTMPDNAAHLVVTSPPYDQLRTYDGCAAWDFGRVADELVRTLRPGGVIVWIVNDQTIQGSETGTSFRQAMGFQQRGLRIHDTMIWRKTNPMCGRIGRRYQSAFEYMFVFSKGTPATWNPIQEPCNRAGERVRGSQILSDGRRVPKNGAVRGATTHKTKNLANVWDLPASAGDPIHPAVFPPEIARRHICTWSDVGDIVLDPFAGSGTTLLEAAQLSRRYVGFEVNPTYCDYAQRRLDECRAAAKMRRSA